MNKKVLQFTIYTKPISINKAYRSVIARRAGRLIPSAILTSEGKTFKAISLSLSKPIRDATTITLFRESRAG